MKVFTSVLLSVLLILGGIIESQAQQVRMFQYSTDVSGGCQYMYLAQNITDGKFFYCKKSSWSSDFVLGDLTGDSLTLDGFLVLSGNVTTTGNLIFLGLSSNNSPIAALEGSTTPRWRLTETDTSINFDIFNTGSKGGIQWSAAGEGLTFTTSAVTVNADLLNIDFAINDDTVANAFRVDAAVGNVFIHDTVNTNNLQGFTINQIAADDHIVTFKSGTDISTGLTTLTEPDVEDDDFGAINKFAGPWGGLQIIGVGEDNVNLSSTLMFRGYGGLASTTKTTSGYGLIRFFVTEHAGSNGFANIESYGNVFSISARVGGADVARLILDEDSQLYVEGLRPFSDNNDTLGTSTGRYTTVHVTEISNDDSAAVTITGGYVLTGPANVGSAGSLTVASGAVAITKTYHTLVVEGGAGSGADSLATATGGVEGDILILKTTTSGANDQVTISDGTGSNTFILAGADFIMNHIDDRLELVHNGTEWVEVSRSNNS